MAFRAASLALATVLLSAGVAHAHSESQGSLQIVHPWVAPAAAGATTRAHPTWVNKGETPLRVTGASSPVGQVDLLRDGQVVDVIEIPAGATLSPDTVQLRIRDLAVALPEGQAMPLTVRLEGQEPIAIDVAIGESTMNPDRMVEVPERN